MYLKKCYVYKNDKQLVETIRKILLKVLSSTFFPNSHSYFGVWIVVLTMMSVAKVTTDCSSVQNMLQK